MAENKEQQTVVTSGFGKLNWRDLGQGALMAGLGAAAGLLYPVLDSWIAGAPMIFNFSLVWKAALGAAVLHLIRKLTGRETLVVTNPTPKQVEAVKAGDATVKVIPEKTVPNNPVNERNAP